MGISGLSCGRILREKGKQVTFFEKSRGVSGRCATKRVNEKQHFDFGAQYFTARDPVFRKQVDEWVSHGVAGEWKGELRAVDAKDWKVTTPSGTARFVGVPSNTAPAKFMAKPFLDSIHFETRVEKVKREGEEWRLFDDKNKDLGTFDAVIVATPSPQAIPLISESPTLTKQISEAKMTPTWTLMISFDYVLPLSFDVAFVNNSDVFSFIALQNSKPQRPQDIQNWVAHGSKSFSEKHLEEQPEEVRKRLVDAFYSLVKSVNGKQDMEVKKETWSLAHRWRFADVEKSIKSPFLWDQSLNIGVIGDYLEASAVPGAYMSGYKLAHHILGIPIEEQSKEDKPQPRNYSLEVIRYVIPADKHADFEKAYEEGGKHLQLSPYCLGYEVVHGDDEKDNYIVFIKWTSAKEHMELFRKSEEFKPFFELVKPYFANIQEMKHYDPTSNLWNREQK